MSSYDIEDHVHIGLWTDWARGAVLGRTFTMSRTQGNLLIAFVATRFWRVLCLMIHRCCSTEGAEHALHHQRQVILRNSSGPDSGLVALVRLSWAWRRLGFRRLLHNSFLALLAVLTLISFTLAGGFSSTISSTVGDVVLIDSTNCGFLDLSQQASLYGPTIEFMANQINNAANYAQQCYASNSSGLLGCGRFVKPDISKKANTNASCPFEDNLCRTSHSNILLDTGYINTSDDFGLNAPVDEQASYRYVLSCAPLVTEDYTSRQNTSLGEVVQYHYGQMNWPDGHIDNYSYRTDDIRAQYSGARSPDTHGGLNFRVVAISSLTIDGQASNGSMYLPMTGLQRSDGDVTIIHLAGDGVIFGEPSEDQWYRPFTPGTNDMVFTSGTGIANGSAQYYMPEEPASPLGCVEQFQFCNSAQPDSSNCGPLASFYDAVFGAGPVFNTTDEELANAPDPTAPLSSRTATLLLWLSSISATNPSTVDVLIHQLGAKSLASQSQLYSGVQFGVSSDQWQVDVTNWFDTLLALQQASYISTVIGPSDTLLDAGLWVSPNDTLHQVLCNSQKMRSSTHTSFSVFGLCFTYVTGGLIILISAIIEPILTFCYKKRGYQRFRELEWATNQQLQLLRLAHEPLGHGNWTRGTKFVPMTEKDEYLGELDVSTDHPVIARPGFKTEHEANHHAEISSNDEATSIKSPPSDEEQGPLEERTLVGGSPVDNHARLGGPSYTDGPLHLDDMNSLWDEILLGNSQMKDETAEEQMRKKAAATGVVSVASSLSKEEVSPLDESPRRVQWQNPNSMI